MQTLSIEYPTDWTDYELIDSGDGEKLERFASYTMTRPDPRALWQKSEPALWKETDATYVRSDNKSGQWNIKTQPPNPWHISYKHLTFTLKPTEFKHVGVFPEQAVNWNWLQSIISGKPLKILNLFAYTGGATMAAAAAGATVTHVDAVKSTIDWAHENVRVSKLEHIPIRWIEEDAYKFVLREQRRGSTYDGIIMDPPRFGRGNRGEVWKLEDKLVPLLTAARSILSPKPAFVLVNAYTADLSSIALGNTLGSVLADMPGATTAGELVIQERERNQFLPNGIVARWTSA
jgi:23S rRNA (cytosine1962-C5)-methyltransferase